MITLQMKGQLKAQVKQAAFIVALGVGVTVGGVAAGALVLQPAVAQATQPTAGGGIERAMTTSAAAVHDMTTATRAALTNSVSALPQPYRRLALPMLFGAIALTGFAATGWSYYRRHAASRTTSSSNRAKSGTKLNGSRTPKAVQALADSGAEPSEIAWRTGLSLDAVAMLLSIGASGRQLRPPTA